MEFGRDSDVSPLLPISDLYGQCLESLTLFLKTLRQPDCLVTFLGLVDVPDIVDEIGRARIWGDQTKANLPATDRRSLDNTLKHDSDLKGEVHQTLMQLLTLSNQATTSAIRKVHDSGQGSITSVSSDSDSDVGGDSDDSDDDWGFGTDSPAGTNSPLSLHGTDVADTADATVVIMGEAGGNPRVSGTKPGRVPRICMLVRQIKAQIMSLFDFSSLLRRSGSTMKYLRQRSSMSDLKSGPLDSPSNHVAIDLDEEHIKEKILQWRLLAKSDPENMFHEPGLDGIAAEESITWLCQRLAKANAVRREQLEYWKSHPRNKDGTMVKLLHGPTARLPKPDITTQQTVSTKPTFSTANYLEQHDTKAAGYATATSASTTNASATYAPTVWGLDHEHGILDLPITTDGESMRLCPYCGEELDEGIRKSKWEWRRHVCKDLCPFVCTFKDCGSGSRLYNNSDEWANHELLAHRRRFVCCEAYCGNVYETRSEIEQHLQHAHYKGKNCISSEELAITVDLCARPVDEITEPVRDQKCIFCLKPFDLLLPLLGHLADHMEEIALFVLSPKETDVHGRGISTSKGKRAL